ncbi:FKBP65 [Symbiodinium natans]|uniref:peptidylprolyl isomerase n=1 Tax=Symbiodinium natans TaxID=878477 RepID=A0A812J3C9_9DINO|nr:FKBP65 [Symbiodinium natans]
MACVALGLQRLILAQSSTPWASAMERRRIVPALALLGSAAWLPLAFLTPGRPVQESSRRAALAGVAGSLLLDAAPGANAEEELTQDLTVLRTGKTQYAKMDYQVLREGKCDATQMGDLVRVKHRAWLENFEEGLPWELTLVGRMEVGPYQDPKRIKVGKTPLTPYDPPSLTDALLGMRPGEIRRVVVPPEFAFGQKGRSVMEPMEDQDIPPNSTLYYEIEMVWSGPAQLSNCIRPYDESGRYTPFRPPDKN